MRIAIITGASSGIGESFLNVVTKEDYDRIWIVARRADRLEALAGKFGKEKVIPVVADLLDKDSIKTISDKLEAEKPTVELLINCAGMGKRGTVEGNTLKDLDNMVELNCNALTTVTKICLPYMIVQGRTFKTGPRILNISSSAAFLPQPGFSVYAASKAYVESFSRALQFEVRKYNIGVTTVCPGPVKTEFLKKATDNKAGEFTGIRALCAADPDKLAAASYKACKKGRGLYVYKVSQKALHVASKLIPTAWILWVEKVTMKQF